MEEGASLKKMLGEDILSFLVYFFLEFIANGATLMPLRTPSSYHSACSLWRSAGFSSPDRSMKHRTLINLNLNSFFGNFPGAAAKEED